VSYSNVDTSDPELKELFNQAPSNDFEIVATVEVPEELAEWTVEMAESDWGSKHPFDWVMEYVTLKLEYPAKYGLERTFEHI
jgi:hypothetical protein